MKKQNKEQQKKAIIDIMKGDEELGLYKNPKYYTPSIEEFCVGFEYEIVYGKDDISKQTFGADLENADGFIPFITPDYLLKYLNDGKIRVKHLDREDIESLDFKLQTSSWDRKTHEREVIVMEPLDDFFDIQFEYVINEQNVYQLLFSKEKITIVHAALSDNSVGLLSLNKNNYDYIERPTKHMVFNTLFHGTIKNKNELKKLLVQLKILS